MYLTNDLASLTFELIVLGNYERLQFRDGSFRWSKYIEASLFPFPSTSHASMRNGNEHNRLPEHEPPTSSTHSTDNGVAVPCAVQEVSSTITAINGTDAPIVFNLALRSYRHP